MHTCKECQLTKPATEYATDKRITRGHDGTCKACRYEQALVRSRTPKGWLRETHNNEIQSSKERGHARPAYTRDELGDWIIANHEELYLTLFNAWAASDYDTNLRPSIDRLDDNKGYSFDNIRLVTWAENLGHQRDNVSKGKSHGQCRTLQQLDIDTGAVIAEYATTRQAEIVVRGRITNTISSAINHGYNAYGFRWAFVTEWKRTA